MNGKTMRNLSRIGILINALVILACIMALISLKNFGSFSHQSVENAIIIKKINEETDLQKLRKFTLGAQEFRESSLELLDKQMVFLKWFLLSAVGISCLNTLCFFWSSVGAEKPKANQEDTPDQKTVR